MRKPRAKTHSSSNSRLQAHGCHPHTWSPLFSPRGRGALARGCHLVHPVSHLFWGGSTSLAWLLIASSDLDSRIASACLWSPCLQSNHPTWGPWRLQEHPAQGEPSTIQASGAGVGNGADLTPLRTQSDGHLCRTLARRASVPPTPLLSLTLQLLETGRPHCHRCLLPPPESQRPGQHCPGSHGGQGVRSLHPPPHGLPSGFSKSPSDVRRPVYLYLM